LHILRDAFGSGKIGSYFYIPVFSKGVLTYTYS